MGQATADVVGLQLETVRKDKALPVLYAYPDVTVNRIETRKDVHKVSSREMRVPLQIRPGSRAGAVNMAGGALGRGTATKYDKATLTPIASRIAVEINQDVLDQTDGEPKAIRKILNLEIANAMKEFRTQLNGWLQTAGDGVLATITASPGGNVFTLAQAPFYAQLLREGQKVSVYNSALTTKRGEMEITKVDGPNNQITTDATPGGTIVTDKLLPEGLSGATPAWYFGIPYQISDSATGTFLGFNRANEPAIRASRVNNNGNALTTPPIRLALDKIIQRVGKVNPKSLVAHMHTTQKAAYEELAVLVSQVDKMQSGNQAVDLLFDQKMMAGVSIETDIQAARDRITFQDFSNWGKAESAPIDFLKNPQTGSYIDRPVDTVTGSQIAAIIFWMRWFGQFFLDNPAGQAYISDLAIVAGYDAI